MKFFARKGALDIPLELSEAQENDELVFFCGAGISYPAGLPDFAGLVDEVYEDIPEIKDELELQSIKSGFYDRALGLLETRLEKDSTTGINLVRRAIISLLKIDSDGDLETHKALLQLSKTNNGKYRLVTTNVDHGFLMAEDDVKEHFDAAPTLPVPKPHKWSTVVHLHGLIDKEQDPNGKHLVFTSGDFGTAYLTERWASKFVTELFLNFTVVFVGYSINDPVIRYMTDAIAAERLHGGHFKPSFVIAEAPPSKKAAATKEWKAKGVEPLLYSKGGKKHPNLHNSLKAWAAHSRDGLDSKERIIKSKARLVPLPPYGLDESVKQVLDTLKERVNKNHEDVTGFPAKVFSELQDPAAPIEWLPILDEEGLLSVSETNQRVDLTSNSLSTNLAQPNKISRNLWGWLLHHLANKVFVRWVIDAGICLHPLFKDMVRRHLDQDSSLMEPYLSFWKIAVSGEIRCNNSFSISNYSVLKDLVKRPDELAFNAFSKLLAPTYLITKSFERSQHVDVEKGVEASPFSIEVVSGLAEWEFDSLVKSDGYPENYTKLLEYSSQSLLKAMKLLSYIGNANDKDDRSHWVIVSIEPHEQNDRFNSLSCLIELNRDLWSALYKQNKPSAQLALSIWRSYKFPVFRRLVLYAYTFKGIITPKDALSYLLEDDGWWLWSVCTYRETFRLLNKIWPLLKQRDAERLLNFVVQGPPRDNLCEDDYREKANEKRWLILAKLDSFGRELFGDALKLYIYTSQRYPTWRLQEGEQDEFTHWHTSSIGNDSDITQDDLFSLSPPDRVTKLLEVHKSFGEGRIDVFRFAGKERTSDVISTLKYMFDQKIWNGRLWRAGLTGIAESDKDIWILVAPMVEQLPDDIYKKEAWAIAWWIRKSVTYVTPADDASTLWVIMETLLDNLSTDELVLSEGDKIINQAINDPVGMIVDAVFSYLNRCKIKIGEGLPSPQPLKFIERVLNDRGPSFTLGRVELFSRLMYFYSIDTKWAQERLIPLLDFDKSPGAVYCWQGYLRNPRVSADLVIDLKEVILKTIQGQMLPKKAEKSLVDLFTFSCLQYNDLFSIAEQRSAFRSMNNEGLDSASECLRRFLSNEKEGKDNIWLHRISPLFKSVWPKGGAHLTPAISKNIALMVLQLDSSFPDAVKDTLPILSPVGDMRMVLDAFLKSDAVENYPSDAFTLLVKLFNDEDSFNNDLLSNLMASFKNSKSSLAKLPDFKKINAFIKKGS